MLFNSMAFLFAFFPLCMLLFYLSKDKYKNIILLIFSLIFYSWGEPKYVFLMLASIIINYILAIVIENFKSKKNISSSKKELGDTIVLIYENIMQDRKSLICQIIKNDRFLLIISNYCQTCKFGKIIYIFS